MIDVSLDRAGQTGTGRWTATEALMLAATATTLDAAVAARNLSSRLEERKTAAAVFGLAAGPVGGGPAQIERLEQALLAGKIACFSQGFGLLSAASKEFGWDLPLAGIAKVWRAGCIIRSAMLDDMAQALEGGAVSNLMFAPRFAERMKASHGGLRAVVAEAALAGIPAPALAAALGYFDMMVQARGTANLLQAQRDFFGAHGFERTDREGGGFHGPWGSHYGAAAHG
jgi:6-phosphogluconate dehydrogenase